jgi:hybrid cluster-associated redox disulfide protein
MKKRNLITGDMTIQEAITLYPMIMEVFAAWGLGCAACHIGAIETIEEGAISHGFSPEEVENLIEELNEAANNEGEEEDK